MNESNKTLINQQIISLEILQNNSVGSIHKKKDYKAGISARL